MWLRALAGLLIASPLWLAGAEPARAQGDEGFRFPWQSRESSPPPADTRPYGTSRGSAYDTRRARPPEERERVARPAYERRPPAYQPSEPLFPFFSAPRQVEREPPPAVYYRDEPRQARRPYQPPREVRRVYEPPVKKVRRYVPAAPTPTPAPKEDKVEVVEVEPSIHVVVFGDAFAEKLAQGLDVVLEDAEDIAIERKLRGDSGLARADVHDWPKVVADYLATDAKVTYAVVMLGANDRQPIREGDVSHEPLSERWRELYRARVDAVVKTFADRKIPLIWVGTPPMKNEKYSADLLAFNEIYRDRVQRGGGVYVDIWPGFVDDQNRYSPVGPGVDGQVMRLRTSDGVLLTRGGANKVAHFVDVELKRLIESRGGAAVAATVGAPAPGKATPGQATPGQPIPGQPAVGQAAAGSPGAAPAGNPAPAKELDVDRLISASLPALPEPQGLPSLPARPVAGPVMPLTRPDVAPGGALVSRPPKLDGDASYATEKALRDGVSPAPKPGRADDFRWPRS